MGVFVCGMGCVCEREISILIKFFLKNKKKRRFLQEEFIL